jgi:hypothetical protein
MTARPNPVQPRGGVVAGRDLATSPDLAGTSPRRSWPANLATSPLYRARARRGEVGPGAAGS